VKDDLRAPGVYVIPCECGQVYIGLTGVSAETKTKVAPSAHATWTLRQIGSGGTWVQPRSYYKILRHLHTLCQIRHLDEFIREPNELYLHQSSMKREDRLTPSGSWKPLIRFLKESRRPPQEWWLVYGRFEDHTLLAPLPRCNSCSVYVRALGALLILLLPFGPGSFPSSFSYHPSPFFSPPFPIPYFCFTCFPYGGTRLRSWLRHCATNRKVEGSIPDGVIGIFHWHNPAGRTVALGLSQPLTEMSTRNISWGVKAARA